MAKQNVVAPEAGTKTTTTTTSTTKSVYSMKRKFAKKLEIGSNGGILNSSFEVAKVSSSPTLVLGEPDTTTAMVVENDEDWMKTHPSALLKFDEIMKASTEKSIVMFLDYDGTLSPIVDDPDQAYMPESMRGVVRDVARYFPTAIVSGRCRDKVYKFVRLAELYYAGSHGMDIKGPPARGPRYAKGSKTVMFQPASEFVPVIDEVYKILVKKTSSVAGARVENNKFCLSVHYRCVDEKSWTDLADEVKAVLKEYPKLKLTQGKKVLEIRPTIKWDKGHALEFLLETLGFANCSNVLPVYIGDDRTDEDAFKVLRDRGQGLGILVSKIPKETNASYSLQEPAEVMEFLRRLVEWKRLSQGVVNGG